MPIARHRGTLAQAHSSQPHGLRLVRTVALFRLRHEDRQGCLRDASAWRTLRSPGRLLRSSEAVVNSVSSILYLAGTVGTRHSVAARFTRHHACGYSQYSMSSGTCNDPYTAGISSFWTGEQACQRAKKVSFQSPFRPFCANRCLLDSFSVKPDKREPRAGYSRRLFARLKC